MLYLQLAILVVILALMIAFANEIGGFCKRLWEKPFTKHVLSMLALSLLIIGFRQYIIHLERYIQHGYNTLVMSVASMMGSGRFDVYLSRVMGLLLLPLLISLLPAGLHWLIKGRPLQHYYHWLWAMFAVFTSVLIFV